MKPKRISQKYVFALLLFLFFGSSKQQSCPDTKIYKKSGDSNCYSAEECNFIVAGGGSNTCLDSCESINKYHNYNSKICVGQCEGDYIYSVTGSLICYSSCAQIPNYNIFYEDSTNHCHSSQPSDCHFYYIKSDGVRKCVQQTDCIAQGNKYFIDDECRVSCPGYFQLEVTESSNDIIRCYETLTKALSNSNVKFYDITTRKCWTSFPSVDAYFIQSPLGSLNTQNEVVRECPYFYRKIPDPSDNTKTCFRCTNACKDTSNGINLYFTKGNKMCQNSCNDFYKYYYDDDNNECFDSCELSLNKKYYYTNNPKCQVSCPSNKYHNYNSHKILNSCGEDNSINLYHKNGGNICYPSCLAIPNGIYKYEQMDNTCISTPITLPTSNYDYFYVKNDGVVKYVKASDCKDSNLLYILGRECKIKCDDHYYTKEVSISGLSTKFTKCFPTPNDCFDGVSSGKIYYNEKLRICWTTFQTGYFVKSRSDSPKILYELVDECENFYYINTADSNLNYCTLACKMFSTSTPTSLIIDLYFINTNRKCETNCINIPKYYYDPDNNECLDTCKDRPKYKFQNKLAVNPTTAVACLEKCTTPTLYYNKDSNICLDHCGDDGSNNKFHKSKVTLFMQNKKQLWHINVLMILIIYPQVIALFII